LNPQGLALNSLQRHLQAQLFGQSRAAQPSSENNVPRRQGERWGVNHLYAKGGIWAALKAANRLVKEKAGSSALSCLQERLREELGVDLAIVGRVDSPRQVATQARLQGSHLRRTQPLEVIARLLTSCQGLLPGCYLLLLEEPEDAAPIDGQGAAQVCFQPSNQGIKLLQAF
jgi:hypothetical protein